MTSLHPAAPRHRHPEAPLRIALLGAPAAPGPQDVEGTGAAEVGRRLSAAGHDVLVRTADGVAPAAARLVAGRPHDVALLLHPALAPLLPLLRARGTATALHVGGLEWQRDGCPALERRGRRALERIAARGADALVADSRRAQSYFEDEFDLLPELIPFGARIVRHAAADLVEALGLVPGMFHLVVARCDPGDGVETVLEGYRASAAALPLVVVGPAGRTAGTDRVRRAAQGDGRIRLLLGTAQDPRLMDQLHAHAIAHLHGRGTGGTDATLLRAMGAGTAVIARDAPVNREVVGTAGLYFADAAQLAGLVEEVERYPFRFRDIGELMQERARARYGWDAVSECWEALAARLARGVSTRGASDGRRTRSAWAEGRA